MDVFDETSSYVLAANSVGCCKESVQRWDNRLIPYIMGEGRPKQSLTGEDQLILIICLFIYPNALADDLCLFIFANFGGIYSKQAITRRCHELGLTMKNSSREAHAAFSENAI